MSVKLECGNCNWITKFNEDECDVKMVHIIGNNHFSYNLSDKEYFCEKCGVELEV